MNNSQNKEIFNLQIKELATELDLHYLKLLTRSKKEETTNPFLIIAINRLDDFTEFLREFDGDLRDEILNLANNKDLPIETKSIITLLVLRGLL